MQSMTIKVAVSLIMAAFPSLREKQDPEEMANLWRDLFSDLDDSLFVAGIKKAILECKYPPSAADINKTVKEELLAAVPLSGHWIYMRDKIKEAAALYEKFSCFSKNENGEPVGVIARKKTREMFDALPMYSVRFFGDYTEFMSVVSAYSRTDEMSVFQKNYKDYLSKFFESCTASDLSTATTAVCPEIKVFLSAPIGDINISVAPKNALSDGKEAESEPVKPSSAGRKKRVTSKTASEEEK